MAHRILTDGIRAAGGKAEFFGRAYLELERPLSVNGALSVERVITLPRNAVVLSPFTVTVEAGLADWATVASVAQTRARTLQVLQVRQWAGTAFAPRPIVSGVGDGEWTIDGSTAKLD